MVLVLVAAAFLGSAIGMLASVVFSMPFMLAWIMGGTIAVVLVSIWTSYLRRKVLISARVSLAPNAE
jgi:hypothetical protein